MNNLILSFQQLAKSNPNANILYPTTHSMIMFYSDKYKDFRKNAKGTKALADKLGIKNFNKFYTNRKQWDMMNNRIPIYYLDALGINESMIATTVEIDQDIFKKVIEEPVKYDHFIQSYKWFLERRYEFREPLNELEAIEYVNNHITNVGFEFIGSRSSITLRRRPYYDVWFKRDGSHNHFYNSPKYRIHNQQYEFKMPYQTGWRI